eukprot:9983-Heterococcus_DN1.PRE.4
MPVLGSLMCWPDAYSSVQVFAAQDTRSLSRKPVSWTLLKLSAPASHSPSAAFSSRCSVVGAFTVLGAPCVGAAVTGAAVAGAAVAGAAVAAGVGAAVEGSAVVVSAVVGSAVVGDGVEGVEGLGVSCVALGAAVAGVGAAVAVHHACTHAHVEYSVRVNSSSKPHHTQRTGSLYRGAVCSTTSALHASHPRNIGRCKQSDSCTQSDLPSTVGVTVGSGRLTGASVCSACGAL